LCCSVPPKGRWQRSLKYVDMFSTGAAAMPALDWLKWTQLKQKNKMLSLDL
jgi:hypothetical protein